MAADGTITIRVAPEVKEAATRRATSEGTSLAEVVSAGLRRFAAGVPLTLGDGFAKMPSDQPLKDMIARDHIDSQAEGVAASGILEWFDDPVQNQPKPGVRGDSGRAGDVQSAGIVEWFDDPAPGAAPGTVTLKLDPQLEHDVRSQAESQGVELSSLIAQTLRDYANSAPLAASDSDFDPNDPANPNLGDLPS
jgi:predicted HicB family RNase H-like nuclease